MATAKKLPSGNWRILVFVGKDEAGKEKYESITAKKKSEVEYLAAKRRLELSEQRKLRDKGPDDLTVGEAVDRYIRDKEDLLSPKTVLEYRGLRRRAMPGLMNVKLKDLTDYMVQLEIDREAKRLAPKSIYIEWGLIQSAVRAADHTINLRVRLPKKDPKEMQIPTNEELARLFAYVEGKRIELPVIIAANCGLRRGEIAALDLHTDVDYTKCTITVTKSIANSPDGWVEKPPKTRKSRRTVIAPQWVIDKLAIARDNGYQFTNPNGITEGFESACKALDLKIRFHDLRHYYASYLLSLGIPDKYAMKYMGHATTNMLKNVYQHTIAEKEKEFAQKIKNGLDMQHDPTRNEKEIG